MNQLPRHAGSGIRPIGGLHGDAYGIVGVGSISPTARIATSTSPGGISEKTRT
jgi:hypothetical protein